MEPTTRLEDLRGRLASGRVRETHIALLCADVVGFTELTERLGDRETLAAMRRAASRIRRTCGAYRGELVEIRGDSFLIAFDSSLDALRSAMAVHRELARVTAATPDERIEVRIALHVGTVLTDGAGYFGRNMILLYRLLGCAGAGETALTREAIEDLCEPAGAWIARDLPTRTFVPKGMSGPTEYVVLDRPDSAHSTLAEFGEAFRVEPQLLRAGPLSAPRATH